MPAHEVEDRLAVLNVRRTLQNPEAIKAHQHQQQVKQQAAKRADIARAMEAIQAMHPGDWRM